MDAVKALASGNLDELICDNCGKHLGKVYDFDENCNYHFCDECIKKAENPA